MGIFNLLQVSEHLCVLKGSRYLPYWNLCLLWWTHLSFLMYLEKWVLPSSRSVGTFVHLCLRCARDLERFAVLAFGLCACTQYYTLLYFKVYHFLSWAFISTLVYLPPPLLRPLLCACGSLFLVCARVCVVCVRAISRYEPGTGPLVISHPWLQLGQMEIYIYTVQYTVVYYTQYTRTYNMYSIYTV